MNTIVFNWTMSTFYLAQALPYILELPAFRIFHLTAITYQTDAEHDENRVIEMLVSKN